MKGMTIIVKKVTQIIAGLIFLYGLYIILFGHVDPGGGFDGGVFIAGAFILYILAFGKSIQDLKKLKIRSISVMSLSILFFYLIAMSNMFISKSTNTPPVFFKNFLSKGTPGTLLSAGFIPLLNICIGFGVGCALITIFLGFVIRSREVIPVKIK